MLRAAGLWGVGGGHTAKPRPTLHLPTRIQKRSASLNSIRASALNKTLKHESGILTYLLKEGEKKEEKKRR